MTPDQIMEYVLVAALISTATFIFTSYILFVRYGLPVYHIMGFYQLYHLFGFVLRPWELYFRGDSPTWNYVGPLPTGGTILWGVLVFTLAHLAMIAGFVVTNPRFGPVPSLAPINFRIGNPLLFTACVSLFLALGAYGSYVSLGNVFQAESDLSRVEMDAFGGQRLVEASGYQTALAELLTITLITLFAIKRTRKLAFVLVLFFVGYRTLAGAGRSSFIAVVLAVSFIWLINQRRRLPTPRMLVGAAAVLLIFNLLGTDRAAMRRVINGESTFSETMSDYWNGESTEGITQNMAEFDVFTDVLMYVPQETGFTYGTQYIRLLIWPIPRFMWPDKPVFTSNINLLDYANFRVLTYTSYADSYMTLGLPGMIIILFLTSFAINSLYRKVTREPKPFVTLLYLSVLIYSTILFRDGPVPAMYFYIVLGLGAFSLVRLGGLRREEQP